MKMSVFKFQLSQLVLSLVEEDRDLYYKTLEFLKCHDPLVIPLQLFKSGKSSSKFLPPIEKFHLRLYLVYERDITDSNRFDIQHRVPDYSNIEPNNRVNLIIKPSLRQVTAIPRHGAH